MQRKSQMHSEKLIESRRVTASQNRARIPTEVLLELEQQTNGWLYIMAVNELIDEKHRVYIGWGIDFREAYGVVYRRLEPGGPMVKLEGDHAYDDADSRRRLAELIASRHAFAQRGDREQKRPDVSSAEGR